MNISHLPFPEGRRAARRFGLLAAGLMLAGASAVAQEGFELEPVIRTADFALELGVGSAEYSEQVAIAPVESAWDATAVQVGASLVTSGRSPLLARLQGLFWATDEAEETWRESGALVQRNQLEASGAEFGADLGVPIVRAERGRVRGWGGAAYRNQQFDRSAFESSLLGSADFGAVGERYDVVLVRAELEGRLSLATSLFVEAGGLAGYAVYTRADNDLLGTIDSSGGTVLEGRLDVGWQANERHAFSAGVRWGAQDLEGETESRGVERLGGGNFAQRIVEWPDNQWDTALFAVRWICAL